LTTQISVRIYIGGKRLDYRQFQSSRYRFALFDKDGKKVYGDDIEDKSLILYDKTPLGHLGIWSIKVADLNIKFCFKIL